MKPMILALAGLVCFWSICGGGEAQTKAPPPDARVPRQASGFGEDEAAAQKVALREAVKQVELWMNQHEPPLESFVVTEDYVRDNVLDGAGKFGDDVLAKVGQNDQKFKTWILRFRADNGWWSDIVRRDQATARQFRAAERETLAFRTVVGLSLLLLAGFGYFRLDEYTQRRYTAWLRLAGAGVLATVLAGWWWMVAD